MLNNSYGMNLQNSWPSGKNAFEVVHRVAQWLPVVLGLVVVHFGDVLVSLSSDRYGVR